MNLLFKEVTVRFLREDGKEFVVGNTRNWRFLKENGLVGFGDINAKINYVDNATADGGTVTSTRLSSVDRTISAAYIVPSLNEVARKTATSFFNPKLKYKIYVTYGDRTRWAEGYLLKASIGTEPNTRKLLKLTATFLFANPYWNSYDNFGKDIAEVRGLLAFPYLVGGFDKGFSPAGLAGGKYNFAKNVVLENDGDVEVYCTAVFTATGNVTNPKLIINEEYVRVIDELVYGDVIEMDFTAYPPTVRKNGENFIGHCDRTSNFNGMALAVGNAEVAFDADNGSDLLQVFIYYNKQYLTV